MRVLVTGSQGALGQDAVAHSTLLGYEVLACDRQRLDITNREQVLAFVRDACPDVIINCAAYNAVDLAEDPQHIQAAHAINALGPQYLAEAAREIGATFIHVSTDCVFAGDRAQGYAEYDERMPINAYGRTKLAGEELVEQVGGDFYIARTARLFGRMSASASAKPSFAQVMLRLAATKPELQIIDEEVGCPTYTPDLARALLSLASERPTIGAYHLVNSGPGVTWFGFAEEIFALKPTTAKRIPVPASAFPKPAPRGKFLILQNTKFPALRSRLEALKDFLQS